LLLLAADTHNNELNCRKESFNNIKRQQVYYNELSIHDDNISSKYIQEGEVNHIDTYLTNVSECKPLVQTQKTRVHSSVISNDCSWIPNDIWSTFPEEARKYLTTQKSASSINSTTVCATIHAADGQVNGAYVKEHQMVEGNTDVNKAKDEDNKVIDYTINHAKVSTENLHSIHSANTWYKKGNSTKATFDGDNAIKYNGFTYRKINLLNIEYCTSKVVTSPINGLSLVDCGANGGLLGDDIKILERTD
jgi:hypothetical protein